MKNFFPKRQYEPKTPIMTEMFLTNHSGIQEKHLKNIKNLNLNSLTLGDGSVVSFLKIFKTAYEGITVGSGVTKTQVITVEGLLLTDEIFGFFTPANDGDLFLVQLWPSADDTLTMKWANINLVSDLTAQNSSIYILVLRLTPAI